tara:strand:+ start:282 stop:1115 length:834 start_codon:yes stop_codon:yes gene_type:complete
MPYIGNTPATQFAALTYQDLTGGSGTSFTLNTSVGSAQDIEVFVNNVRQEPGVAYTISGGTTLNMTGTIASTDDFYVVFQGKAVGTVTHPPLSALQATTGTFSGGITATTGSFSSTLGVTGKITSTAGITFGSDTAAANVLDDYEEGTWVPVFADAVSGGNTSSTSATQATYIKIGSLVHVNVRFDNISDSGLTSSGTAVIRGFPYVSQGISVNSPWMQSVDVGSNPVHIVARIIDGVQYIRFDQVNDDGVDTTLTVAAFDSGLADVQLSMTYQTTF